MVKSSSDHQSSEKLVSSVESSHPGIIPPARSFVLNSDNTTFAGRASDVFNRLSPLENQHSIWMANNETHDSFETDENPIEDIPSTSKADDADTFKKPYLPVRRSQKRGNIRGKRNTRVWKKYSLKDTPLTTDAKNAAVAFEFLSELRKKREEINSDEKASEDGKVMFRKPKKKNLVNSTMASSTEVSSSSETMKVSVSKNSDSAIKLDHLQDEFDDE